MNQSDKVTTIIKPRKGGLPELGLSEISQYGDLFYFLMVRDIKVRYKQTVIGGVWAILQPFMIMVVFTVFGTFAKIPSDNLPYPIFLYAALLPWQFFSNGIVNASNSIVGSTQLITKIYFPRAIIPASALGCGLLDFAVAFLMLILLMIYYGIYPGIGILLLPFLIAVIVGATLGVGLFLSALSVSYRDFRYVIPFLIQIWLFITPVIYPISMLPEKLQWLINLNPMAGLITAFRASLLNLPIPWSDLALSSLISFFLLFLGLLYFRKMESRFADII